MIRAILASRWLPLLYWTVAFVAMIWGTDHESLKQPSRNHAIQTVLRSSVPRPGQIPDDSFTPRQHPDQPVIFAEGEPPHFWYFQFSVCETANSSRQKPATAGVNNVALPTEPQTAGGPPVTMLSIRVDPPQNTVAKTLTIQCRTSAPFSNSHGRTVTMHGVVSQEDRIVHGKNSDYGWKQSRWFGSARPGKRTIQIGWIMVDILRRYGAASPGSAFGSAGRFTWDLRSGSAEQR
jgi:hypothetical protein